MKIKGICTAIVATVGCALMTASLTHAAPLNLHADPGVFIGKANDPNSCGNPYPAGHKIVAAEWVKGIGLPDDTGNDSQGLILSKNGPTTDCSAAYAVINGAKGKPLTELGFDIRNGGHCGAGAPRFNVTTENGFSFQGGCANWAKTDMGNGWSRVRSTTADLGAAAGSKIVSIVILFDEGVDTGPDFSGFAIIDNIDVNGSLADRE